MKLTNVLGALAVLAVLGGCATAPQAPVPLSAAVQQSRVAVAATALPKVDTSFPGANCLLCLATASAANSALTKQVQAFSTEEVGQFKELLAKQLRERGMTVKVLPETLDLRTLPKQTAKAANLAPRDFRALAQQHEVDRILVIDVTQLGIERPYAAYIPTAEPKAVVRGSGFIVNLSDNSLDWYVPLNVAKSTDGTWDEPPQFPALTNAYFQAIEIAKDALLQPFVAR